MLLSSNGNAFLATDCVKLLSVFMWAKAFFGWLSKHPWKFAIHRGLCPLIPMNKGGWVYVFIVCCRKVQHFLFNVALKPLN